MNKFNNNSKTGLLMAAVATAALANTAHAAIGVRLNGKPLWTTVPPLQRGGRTLLPMRDVFTALGAKVQWNGLTQGISARRGTTAVNMQIGNRTAQVNGQPVMLDQAPMMWHGSTMVPLRFVSESMGARVGWNNALQLVSINTGANTGSGSQVAASRTITVPAGSVVPVTIDSTLSSNTSHVNDTFTTSIVSVRPGDSEFPAGSKLEGVVTEATPKTDGSPGALGLEFRTVILPDGQRANLQGSLINLDDASVTNPSPGRIVAKNTKAKSSDKTKMLIIGAGAGFLLGKVIKQNALITSVLGAAGGYLYSQSKDKDKAAEASVPQGTKIGVRLDSTVSFTDSNGYAYKRTSYVNGAR